MKTKIFTIALLLTCLLTAQWSTSPYADDGLYVCWGFNPGIVTFDDGSSIVLGVLSDYIYAQKLDPEGYKMWDDQVLVHYNANSDMVADAWNNHWCCSDGDGGVIIFWLDKRDAYIHCGEPVCVTYSNSLYLQRVDKNGNKMWGNDGILVSGAKEGLKQARITSDGEGGCALLYSEERFYYPGADSTNYLKITRYNSEGKQLWITDLDSNKTWSNGFGLNGIYKGGNSLYLTFYKQTNYLRRININGDINSYSVLVYSGVTISNSGDVFFEDISEYLKKRFVISKVNIDLDTLWTSTFSFENFCSDIGGRIIPDNKGGAFLTHKCQDSIMYYDSFGNLTFREFKGIDFGGFDYPDNNNGILSASDSLIKKFDEYGELLWSLIYLKDPLNAYSAIHAIDNNGGMITVYWSTLGGIYAQHTGRYGELGVVVGVDDHENNTPLDFALYQNYPNPFNPTTTIKYNITPLTRSSNTLSPRERDGVRVSLKIYNLLGQQVATLVNKLQSPGTYEVQWNASNFPSGVYFYTLYINNKPMATKKLLLIK